jgi:hypothetical protein
LAKAFEQLVSERVETKLAGPCHCSARHPRKDHGDRWLVLAIPQRQPDKAARQSA